ncbi:MAG TPA: hypothetical protein VE986_09320 [Hyphomicrobiales bacterium]|nr:hypothetical protein [Hyphomicrobiales bacterium]
MRILALFTLAAFVAAASLPAAYAQSTQAPAKAKACKGRAEADCQAPDCVWVAPTANKKGYCRKPPKTKNPA